MVIGWGSHADRSYDQNNDNAGVVVGDVSAVPTPRVSRVAAEDARQAALAPGAREQVEWDEFVRHHIADVWSHATAEGLSRADAVDVCELVWRNAAQRLPSLVGDGDARRYLLTDVRREARRILRLRSSGAARVGAARGIEFKTAGPAAGLAQVAAGTTRTSDAR